MKKFSFFGYSFVIRFASAVALLCLVTAARGQSSASVFVTLGTTVQTAGTADFPPVPVVINGPGAGWPFSAAAVVPGTTWNKAYRPTATPTASGTYTEDAPFPINTLNNAPLYSADGALSSIRLSTGLVGTFTRAEPGYINVSGALDTTELLNSVWRIYASTAYLRFRFTGLTPNAHFLLYCYASTANQGGRYILHPSNFPAVRTSTYIYPGATPADQLPTSYVDLAGHSGVLSLYRLDNDGNKTVIAPATTNTPAVTGSNTIWGALHAVATLSGDLTFRTDTSGWDGRRQYAGFQLIPYPAPTITEQPDSEMVGVLNQITEFFAVARDVPYLSDADQNPLSYQWQVSKDSGATWTDIPIQDPTGEGVHFGTSTIRDPALPTDPDATPEPARKITSVLTINATQRADAGWYRLKTTNVAGGVSHSSHSVLSVIDQPAPFLITQQPTPASIVVGDSLGLSVAVSGTPPFTFVWQKSTTADFTTFTTVKTGERGPATSDTLSFSFARRSDLGYYRAAITDVTRRNPIYSNIVYVYVEYAPPIITPPARQSVAPGNNINLFGNVYSEIEVTQYKWQVSRDNGATWIDVIDGAAYSGAATETLRITNASVAEAGIYRIVATNAMGTTISGTIPLTVAAPLVAHPVSLATDKAGHLYVTDDTSNTVHQLTLATGSGVQFAGQAGVAGHADGYYNQASFSAPLGAVAGPANTVFLADSLNATIRYVQANGSVQTLAGSSTVRNNTDGVGTAAAFNAPVSVGVDAAGNLYVADNVAHTIRRITPLNFDVTTLAGAAGTSGSANAIVTNSQSNPDARFNAPGAVAVSPVNIAASTPYAVTAETPTTTVTTLYVADTANNTIRKVALTWYLDRDPITNIQTRTRISRSEITTIAGLAGVSGSTDGAGLAARFNGPSGIAVDAVGAIYVADTGNHTVRKIVYAGGVISVTTIGGLPGVSGYQNGPGAANSLFNQPRSVSVDADGNVYVADTGNAAVRKISTDGTVSTFLVTRGTDPVPPTNSSSGGGSDSGATIPPAGAGDRGGDMGGGGAPSHWFLGALALLALLRTRRQIMKTKDLICIVFAALLGGVLATAPSARAQNPAVFVNLSTTQATTAGEMPTAATTFTIAAPGSGWNFGAAAPFSGETWNNILSPHANDQVKPSLKGYVRYDVVPLITANNIALAQPDGSLSGVTLTASAVLDDTGTATNAREVPRLVNPTGSTPAGLLNTAWRIYEGGNLLRFAFAGLPVDAHYLVYGYATTNGANQGAKFTLAASNSLVTPAVWFDTNPVANTAPSVFVDTAGVLAPSVPAPLQVLSNAAGGANSNTTWGVVHARVDSEGRVVINVGRNANNSGYPNGFQLIPYPKATITTQPVPEATVLRNDSITLTVTATAFDSSDSISYQWRKDGAPIDTATNATANTAALTIANAQAADAGAYTVVVTHLAGNVVSEATVLTVTAGEVAPSFTTQPAPLQRLLASIGASFTAVATGIPAPTYQWYKGTELIDGATNATYTIANVQNSHAGSYTVVATNTAGTLSSDAAVLEVIDPVGPAIVGDGNAAGTTGGAGGTVYVVTTATDLNARLQLAQPAIITVVGTIDVRTLSSKRVDVKSNKTLQGADSSATIIGNVNIDGSQNVIVRGINITNPGTVLENGTGPRYVDGGDGLTIRNCSNVLVTHCTFYDCADGMCDLTYDVANATVSWCKFYYTPEQISHRFTMILGNEATTVAINATLHHNWWSTRADQRMPAAGFAKAHMYGNFFNCTGNYYCTNARGVTQFLSEYNYYTNVNNPMTKQDDAVIRTIRNIYDNVTGDVPDAGTGAVFTPAYSYTLDATASIPTVVPAHAGNTAGFSSVTPAASAPIGITGAPASLFPGETITLAPSVSGGTSFQWRFNNAEIDGATSESLVLASIQASQFGVYTVVVGNTEGTFTVSTPVTLVARDVPLFVGQNGGSAAVVTGKTVSFHPSITGESLTYQWQQEVNGTWVNLANNASYSGATTGSLSVRNAATAQAGNYRLIASNPSGSTTSSIYTLAVTPIVFPNPTGVAVDAYGDLYVSDSSLNVVRKVPASGTAILVAGIPSTAGSQDGVLGKSTLNAPGALAIDAFGNLYVTDTGNATVRAIARDGTVTTLAGDPTKRGNRDGIGTAALFASPNGQSFDRTNGVTYVADTNNHTIRRLTPQALQVGLFAGNTVLTISGSAGMGGDTDVAAITLPRDPPTTPLPNVALVRYNHPGAVAFVGSYLYVADTGNNTIRRILLTSGDNQFTSATIAGTPGVTGSDDGTGLAALFNQPQALVADATGSFIYVADTANNTIRRVTSAGVVTTLAGIAGISGLADGSGDAALFNRPIALALDVSGTTLYVADAGNAAIRKIAITGTTATVSTVSVTAANDTVPSVGAPTPAFTPTVDSHGSGGGGAPSSWYLAAIAALALVRRFVKRR